ncbi:tol-like protein [Moniliophthora roreri]|uniref:Heterokaryon incompatibility domain-containing protein n=1 Tax=Moniliophthora roreri TaxID=221103 RepID=A0A0W0FV09_MONRR|nr:tol-like protein [Moniliophthora roreri]
MMCMPHTCSWKHLVEALKCVTSRQAAASQSENLEISMIDASARSLVCEGCWAGPFSQESWRRLMNGEDIMYATAWSRIQAAADHGCGLCKLLIIDKENHKDQISFRLSFGAVRPFPGVQHVTPLHAQFLTTEVEGYEIHISNNVYYLHTSPDDPAATEIVARDPIRDVRSQRAYSLGLECLQECVANHDSCPKLNDSARLPTRVIDCLDPEHPKLFVSNGMHAAYAALSYVWGGEQPNCTVTTNLDTYIEGINIDLIPQTTCNAIEAANRYGLRYLWVDAFCIIQDSKEDKKVELTQLRRIFRDAYFTIIASCAPSAFTGFLHDRSPSTSHSPRLPFWCKDGRLGTVSTYPMFTPYDGSGEPVNQRAWCLEERLLSARKLVYASDTLQYHCQTAVSYIGQALAGPRYAERLPDVMFIPDAHIAKYVAGWKGSDWREVRMAWAEVVMNYTNRVVTKPKDKLTAFGGVAEQFHRVWHPQSEGDSAILAQAQGRYLAGLWEKFLLQDLLWKKASDSLRARPTLYLAPSWSWASVDGQVSLYRALDHRLDAAFITDPTQLKSCEILECNVGLDDERLPHGKVKSGSLTLRATMVPTTWRIGMEESKLFVRGDNVKAGLLTLDVHHDDRSLVCVGEIHIDSTEDVRGQVWAVPILWNIGPAPDDIHAAGLFVTSAGNGQFKRVGFWESPELLEPDAEVDRQLVLAWFESDESTRQVLEII